MARPGTPAERRDVRAADRDDGAAWRDADSQRRDEAAGGRDTHALDRDHRADGRSAELKERLLTIRLRLVARLRRIEELDVDPADWPDLAPAALARLRAHTAEQRRLAMLDRTALSRLLDELDDELDRASEHRAGATSDRGGAAADRRAAARDRGAAAGDRAADARDRDQAAVEREQAEPGERETGQRGPEQRGPGEGAPVVEAAPEDLDESVVGRAARALDGSRRRIAESNAFLGGRRAGAPPDDGDLGSRPG